MKNFVLSFLAVTLAILGITYTGCKESNAEQKASGSTVEIKKNIAAYNQLLTELQAIHDKNITDYAQQMGVTSNSEGLAEITAQNALLDANRSRIEYHRLQLIQADTTNQTRNTFQLEELAADISKLQIDGEIIKAGIGETVITKVPK